MHLIVILHDIGKKLDSLNVLNVEEELNVYGYWFWALYNMHLLITISGEEIRLYEIYEELYGSIYLENYSIEKSGVLLDGGKIVVFVYRSEFLLYW